MNFDPNYETRHNKHFKTRATGVLFMGPIQQKGYDNKVLQLTANEMEFEKSEDAQKFIERQRKKFSNIGQMSNNRKLKMISRNDD